MIEVPPRRTWRAAIPVVAVGVFAGLMVISRRPDAISNPQFFAEDATVWFSDGYNLGPWRAILVPTVGYLNVLPRLVVLLATPFGVAHAPLVFNIFALVIQLAPVLFLASNRLAERIPSLWVRLGLAGIYLLTPSAALNVTLSQTQWRLVVLATLVILAPTPRSRTWRVVDVLVVVLCALTGPFAMLMLPLCLTWWVVKRRRWTGVLGAITAMGTVVQLWTLLHSGRSPAPLGASPAYLLTILSDRIVLAGLFGQDGPTSIYTTGLAHPTLTAGLVCLCAAPVAAFAAWKAPWELRLFGAMALGIVVAGLVSPLGSVIDSQWQLMSTSRTGERYFFMAEVAWLAALCWAAFQVRHLLMRRAALALVGALFLSGSALRWSYPAFVDRHWQQAAAQIESAPSGTRVIVTTNPGPPWAVNIMVK